MSVFIGQEQVLDKGFVRLDAYSASDLDVVNAARVSFGKRSVYHNNKCAAITPGSKNADCDCSELIGTTLSAEDTGVLKFLMRNRHTSPFEHGFFRFHVKLPLVVVREWQRHRTWSYNEMSGRYTEIPHEWYVPHRDQIRNQVGKPGAYTFERVESDTDALMVRDAISGASRESFNLYRDLLDRGIAKEQARLVLPVNMYTEMHASVDPLNLMRFLSLRNSEHAMFEIRAYSKILEQRALEVMPVTFQAFIDAGRVI